jgi:hypothetical protein
MHVFEFCKLNRCLSFSLLPAPPVCLLSISRAPRPTRQPPPTRLLRLCPRPLGARAVAHPGGRWLGQRGRRFVSPARSSLSLPLPTSNRARSPSLLSNPSALYASSSPGPSRSPPQSAAVAPPPPDSPRTKHLLHPLARFKPSPAFPLRRPSLLHVRLFPPPPCSIAAPLAASLRPPALLVSFPVARAPRARAAPLRSPLVAALRRSPPRRRARAGAASWARAGAPRGGSRPRPALTSPGPGLAAWAHLSAPGSARSGWL